MAETELQFASIEDACRLTGLSKYFLRKGCRDGSIPCIRTSAGQRSKYLVDLPAYRRQLDEQREEQQRAQAFQRARRG